MEAKQLVLLILWSNWYKKQTSCPVSQVTNATSNWQLFSMFWSAAPRRFLLLQKAPQRSTTVHIQSISVVRDTHNLLNTAEYSPQLSISGCSDASVWSGLVWLGLGVRCVCLMPFGSHTHTQRMPVVCCLVKGFCLVSNFLSTSSCWNLRTRVVESLTKVVKRETGT